ncbi:MAG: 4Fe-4S dicluster domain-containing protein [Eubacteriales bacterium]|nr:4Fe-4S dicluster domain-containing protein [Eubacteriales bacterium]
MSYIPERGSTHVYKVNKISKEEIHSMAEQCVYEQPPFCNAACPLKLDTKSMLKAAATGDFNKALQLYERIAPFPLILAAGCDAPCETKCRLKEVGDSISVREIERAVSRFGVGKKSGSVFKMYKKTPAAIFGSGLFSLMLAGELEKKAYPLTVFCEEGSPEEFLSSETEFLTEEEFESELMRLNQKDIKFEFNCDLTHTFFEEKRGEFTIVCASEKCAKAFFPDAVCDESLMIYEKEQLVMGCGSGVMAAAFGAKKAAVTADRLAQKLDPRNTRGDEGPAESKLYTDLSAAGSKEKIAVPPEGYTKEQAMEEAKRCIQCHCDECFKACAYIQHYQKNPALMTREIYNNTQIIMGDHQMNKPMNACALCGQCKVVCPNGFDMSRVCQAARRNMVSTDKMPNSPHEFALLDMLFSNEDAFLSCSQPGHERCRYVFFPGCQSDAIAPETVRAAYTDLCTRLDGGVALMLGCCGAIADWAGRTEMYEEQKAFIRSELSKLGDPVVIAGCPTCAKELREQDGIEVLGIWDILNEIGLPEGGKAPDRLFALHDSCGARGDAQTQNAIRTIAGKLGCTLIDTEYSSDRSPCCGYGGLTAYANREVAKEMTEKCLERSDAPYITYCMACRDRFAREGRESRHILELIYGTDAGSPPDISEKRYNRLRLKNDLLHDLRGEEPEEEITDGPIEFTDECLKMMDDRMILKSDVIQVIRSYKETGEAIEDGESGLLVCRERLGNVTFWVKFSEDECGKVTVHRAWSHRMTIQRRIGG